MCKGLARLNNIKKEDILVEDRERGTSYSCFIYRAKVVCVCAHSLHAVLHADLKNQH
jgi:hypothetical protein